MDAEHALTVLENDIMSDNKPTERVDAAIIVDQAVPEMLVEDIGVLGQWAKDKKPTWEAVKTFFPIVKWMQVYKVTKKGERQGNSFFPC